MARLLACAVEEPASDGADTLPSCADAWDDRARGSEDTLAVVTDDGRDIVFRQWRGGPVAEYELVLVAPQEEVAVATTLEVDGVEVAGASPDYLALVDWTADRCVGSAQGLRIYLPDHEAACAWDVTTTGTLRVEVTALTSGASRTFALSVRVARHPELDHHCG